jgi:hypothetical protein
MVLFLICPSKPFHMKDAWQARTRDQKKKEVKQIVNSVIGKDKLCGKCTSACENGLYYKAILRIWIALFCFVVLQ